MVINMNSNHNSLRAKKNEFRDKYKTLRIEMSNEERKELDYKIAAALRETLVYKHSTQILIYASTQEEIDTYKIWENAIEDGKKVLLPKCVGEHSMVFYYVESKEDLESGVFNLLEPKEGKLYEPLSSDICIVPALTYDKYGYRLGYGRGFYDRFLADFSGAKVGLCYNSFVESQVPKGRYDVKTDVLITEKGVFTLQKLK